MALEIDVKKQRDVLRDLADSYLSGHNQFTPEQKQVLFKELEHQQERLSRLKNFKVKEE